MHAIDEVYIGKAPGAEHHLGPGRAPPSVGVGRPVLRPLVGLRFHNPTRQGLPLQTVDQHLPQKLLRHSQGVQMCIRDRQ